MHTIHSHTHPAQKKKPCRDQYYVIKGFGIFAHYALADFSGLNQSQTPFPHRTLQFNCISCPLPLLGLKMHDMKEGFSMELEGREKWVFSKAETGQQAWPPELCQWTWAAGGLSTAPKHYPISRHKQNLYHVLPWSLLRGKYSVQIKIIIKTLAGEGRGIHKGSTVN